MSFSQSPFSFFNSRNRFINGLNVKEACVSSYFFSKGTFFRFRTFALLYCVLSFAISLISWFLFVNEGNTNPRYKYVFYLTKLSFLSVFCYIGFTWVLSYRHLYKRKYPTPFTSTVYALLYACNCTFPIIVLTLYWWLLHKTQFYELKPIGKVVSCSEHAVVPVFMIVDMSVGAMGLRLWSILSVIVTCLLYLGWTFIYHGLSGQYVYYVLNLKESRSKIVYPAVTVGTLLVFFMVYLFHLMKKGLFSKIKNPLEVRSQPNPNP